MKGMRTVKEVSSQAAISIRTLHYYDQIGLLVPDGHSEKGYRLYTEENLLRLQQILFFKEIGVSLKQIKVIIENPEFKRGEALEKQKEILLLKQKRLDKMIERIDEHLAGSICYDQEVFSMEEIKKLQQQYKEEVEGKWGHSKAYKECQKKTESYTKKEWNEVKLGGEAIFQEMAGYLDRPISDPQVQECVTKWQNHITQNFYECTHEILFGLGQMYTADERFVKNMDQFGIGLAEFMSRAIAYYCQS